MPWFPDFYNAMALARIETRTSAHADPVRQYFNALTNGDSDELETAWPGEVVVYDPRAGEVRGHKQLHDFVRRSQKLLEDLHARTETVASTTGGNRAVVELVAHVTSRGQDVTWPVAIVAEACGERSIVFRSYFSRWHFDGRRHLRQAVLSPEPVHLDDVVGRFQAALDAGDTDAVVSTFTSDGYFREPIGPPFAHRGARELRSFFEMCFSAGGGIQQQDCRVTDDGVRCAVEYNCVRWGSHEMAPQAGIAVFERSPDGLLAGARVYDDVDPPVSRS